MRAQLLPPLLADDFKWTLLEITGHVVRALFARRGPEDKLRRNLIDAYDCDAYDTANDSAYDHNRL